MAEPQANGRETVAVVHFIKFSLPTNQYSKAIERPLRKKNLLYMQFIIVFKYNDNCFIVFLSYDDKEDILATCGGNVFVFCKHVIGCDRWLIVARVIGASGFLQGHVRGAPATRRRLASRIDSQTDNGTSAQVFTRDHLLRFD